MKLPEMKWTQRNCIMCTLVIIAIFLTMYLFRHYTLIEGFDFSMPDTSKITSSASSLTASASSLTSSLPSFSSGFGAIGPLPADNKISDETLEAVKTTYKDIKSGLPPGVDLSKYATEDEAKSFVSNKKWTWSSTLLDCIKSLVEKSFKERAQGAELTEDQKKMIDDSLNRIQSMPPRYMIGTEFFKSTSAELPCLKDATQSSLLSKIFNSSMFLSSGPDTKLPIPYQLDKNDNSKSTKYLYCNNSQPTIVNFDEAKNTTVSTATTYSEFPNIIKSAKFNFIGKDGKTIDSPPDGFDLCNPAKIQQSPFILDNGGVSPFYSAFWGVPASSSSGSSSTDSTPASVSSSNDPKVVLQDMKAKLNSMSL